MLVYTHQIFGSCAKHTAQDSKTHIQFIHFPKTIQT